MFWYSQKDYTNTFAKKCTISRARLKTQISTILMLHSSGRRDLRSAMGLVVENLVCNSVRYNWSTIKLHLKSDHLLKNHGNILG